MWKRYVTAATVAEVLEVLSDQQEQARVVAGATDLILELERGVRKGVEVLVDITRIPGLDIIRDDGEGWIHLGPLVTHNHVIGSELLKEHAFGLVRACWEVGAPQIRNRGTIAGNLITASPANDSIPPLMGLGAMLSLISKTGERVVPLSEFYTGVRGTVMRDDEFLLDIAFPKSSPGTYSTFYKLGLRNAQAISVVNAAVKLNLEGERVRAASITLGSVSPTIIQAPEAETMLEDQVLTMDLMREASRAAADHANPIDDLRGSAHYRKAMVSLCVLRCLRSLAASDARTDYPSRPVMLWGPDQGRRMTALQGSFAHEGRMPIETTINGKPYRFDTGFDKTLLRLIREEAGLIGTKEGCAEGECGACTVFLDRAAVMACLVPAPRAHRAEIITVEGLPSNGKLHPIQQSFIDEGAVQCGYCTPGFLMSGAKLLEEVTDPTRDEIRQAITGNLCRCTGYYSIVNAIEKAAKQLA